MGFSIEIKGLTKVEKLLKSKRKEVEVKIKKGMARAAILVQGEVKQSIAGNRPEKKSVDTGRFLNSVEINVEPDSAEIFSNLPYAEKLEDGTSKFRARNHFKNTAARTTKPVTDLIENEISKI